MLALFRAVLRIGAQAPCLWIEFVHVFIACDYSAPIFAERHCMREHEIRGGLQTLFVLRCFQHSSGLHDGLLEAIAGGGRCIHSAPFVEKPGVKERFWTQPSA
jgi:hypothetical protein